ncbi:MAG: hypothetical protein JKY34_10350 [Kordiimonadaceae bacterium]|nr:hypothetical protein [Kordiimonadaceae bacterium]
MAAGPLLVYNRALNGLFDGSLPSLTTTPLSAVLLSPSHGVDLAAHETLADITADEIENPDYAPAEVTGERVEVDASGPCFHSDTINFGDPVTLGPARYVVLVCGAPGGLEANSLLLGIAELTSGGAVEAQRSKFTVSPPAEGWFRLARG